MTSTPSSSPHESGAQIHRRETIRQIVLPFIGAGLVILALFVLAALLNDPMARHRVAVVADFLFMLMVLCPSVICMSGIYLVVVVAIYGMQRLHHSAGTPLERLEHATETMAKRIESWTDAVNQKTASFSMRFASLAALLSLFDKPEDTPHARSESTTNPKQ